MAGTAYKSVQEMVDSNGDLVDYLFNETLSPHAVGRVGLSPVPVEYTNWRDEQRAWRESVILFDQSHHMPEMFIKGPDAVKLLSRIGINSFASFPPLRAKQFMGCNHDGHVIGECVLQHLEDGTFELISGQFLQNWVQFNAETGDYDVDIRLDPATAWNPNGRTFFRYQIDGPHAQSLFDDVVEGGAPEIKFFHMAKVRIAGCEVYALRHGMAGHKGVELSGSFADGGKVVAALLAAGAKYGIRRGGLKTYFSTAGEAGWVGYPPPAVFTDPELQAFREWLPGTSWEASTQFGGSFRSNDIRDYYVTPWDRGLDKLIKFDHDFIGREALERIAAEGGGKRKRVTLVWDDGEAERVFASLMSGDVPFKYLEMPASSYAFQMVDEVRVPDGGSIVGVSCFTGYTINEGRFLSIAYVAHEHAEPGTELLLTWGEPDGGSRKPQVERHRQTPIRVTVAPAPYARHVQDLKNADMVKEIA